MIIHNGTKVINNLETNTMDTKIINLEMPAILPHGWKKNVAKLLGIHVNTVTNALEAGKGYTYERIMETAKKEYGTPIKNESDEKEPKCHI